MLFMKYDTTEKLFYIVYDFMVIPLLWFYFFIAQWFNPKIREGRIARRRLKEDLVTWKNSIGSDKKIVLFHCSSLGEVEQAKPLIEAIKREKNEIIIVVSFYSPSGYQHYMPNDSVSLKIYLPFDSSRQAKMFFNILDIKVWIIVKHDIWPNHLRYAKRRGVQMILIDANLPPHSRRIFPLIRLFYKSCFRWFTYVLPVSGEDAERFQFLYPYGDRIIPAGDTRYDQVMLRSKDAKRKELEGFEDMINSPVLICGSVWQSDTEMILPALSKILNKFPALRVIIVPHEPIEEYLLQLEKDLAYSGIRSVRYSALKNHDTRNVILIDRIGILAHVYKYGTICYVGGSRGPGVHNVMEPAIMGKPVLFGPRHTNSFEALELIRRGGGFSVISAEEFKNQVITLLSDERTTVEIGKRAAMVIQEQIGATERIMNILRPLLP